MYSRFGIQLDSRIKSARCSRLNWSSIAEFDVILLDVMMPGMNGFSVCRALKSNEKTRLIPVLIMTGLGAVDDRVKGIEAGADDFFTKPVDNHDLLMRIQTQLRNREWEKEMDLVDSAVAADTRRLALSKREGS